MILKENLDPGILESNYFRLNIANYKEFCIDLIKSILLTLYLFEEVPKKKDLVNMCLRTEFFRYLKAGKYIHNWITKMF